MRVCALSLDSNSAQHVYEKVAVRGANGANTTKREDSRSRAVLALLRLVPLRFPGELHLAGGQHPRQALVL